MEDAALSYTPTDKILGATSIMNPEDGPPVTVRFLRWHQFGQTAYQKGQFAGFGEEDAKRLVKSCAAQIVDRR